MKTTTKPMRTTTWADFTVRAIKAATRKTEAACVKPHESLGQKEGVSSLSCYFLTSFIGKLGKGVRDADHTSRVKGIN